MVDQETGHILWQEPNGSPLSLCYAADLGIGYHQVDLVIEQTSVEEERYSWSFEITE